jgi:hypothetical protein
MLLTLVKFCLGTNFEPVFRRLYMVIISAVFFKIVIPTTLQVQSTVYSGGTVPGTLRKAVRYSEV